MQHCQWKHVLRVNKVKSENELKVTRFHLFFTYLSTKVASNKTQRRNNAESTLSHPGKVEIPCFDVVPLYTE